MYNFFMANLEQDQPIEKKIEAHLDWCIKRAIKEYKGARTMFEKRANCVESFVSDYGKLDEFAPAQAAIGMLATSYLTHHLQGDAWLREFIHFMVGCGTRCWGREEMEKKKLSILGII
ncbi:MAG: hypothetical protein N2654_07745 [Deltaproteobacteria bacterium]|nr:hypothetical protein [Deltaproteobacteria bacterium]